MDDFSSKYLIGWHFLARASKAFHSVLYNPSREIRGAVNVVNRICALCARHMKHEDGALALLAATALMSVILWADLLGHGPGFESSATVVQGLGNSRLFFLVGFTLAAFASIALAKHAEKMGSLPIRFSVVVSVVGTLLYSGSHMQALFPSDAVAIAGLFLCGIGYYATTLLSYCELAKARRLSVAIAAVAAALFLKTVFGSWLSVLAPIAVQIALSCMLPAVSFASLSAMAHLGSGNLDDYRSRSSLSNAGVSDLLFLLVAVSLVLAALRGTSHLGLWGEGYSGSPVSTVAGYATVGVALLAFAHFTLVRNSNNHMLVRFQPAFLVLAAGFVIYVLQDEFFTASGPAPPFRLAVSRRRAVRTPSFGDAYYDCHSYDEACRMDVPGRQRRRVRAGRHSMGVFGARYVGRHALYHGSRYLFRHGCGYQAHEHEAVRNRTFARHGTRIPSSWCRGKGDGRGSPSVG